MKVYFKVSSLLILLALSLANIGLWAFVNRPMEEKPWSGVFRGLSYSPFHGDQDPQAGAVASYAEIDEDLRFLQDKTAAIRTYSALDGIEQVPRIAAKCAPAELPASTRRSKRASDATAARHSATMSDSGAAGASV